jgi:tetratricopeptide (TPR) repeat protein
MTRDNIVFATCGLLLGLIIGSLIIGPKIAQSKLASAQALSSEETAPMPAAAAAAAATPSAPSAGAGSANAMEAVRSQLAVLKQTIERDPNNFDALSQLGNMYMDAAKYPQAIDYYERALKVREEPNLRTDLGICYKQAGQLEKALAAFDQVGREQPGQWQALFNEAVVLFELHRIDEARALGAKLKQMRPTDPEVLRLNETLAKAPGQ